MIQLEELVRQFKQHGFKMTPQRRAILEAVAEHTCTHPTAEQIHERVLRRMPDISLATVYNTLHKLVDMEQVYELNLGHGMRRYELARTEHAHLVCKHCGRIQDLQVNLRQLNALLGSSNGFSPIRHDITVFGLCDSCRQKPSAQT